MDDYTQKEKEEFEKFCDNLKNVSVYCMLDTLAQAITDEHFQTAEECLDLIDFMLASVGQNIDPNWFDSENNDDFA